MHEIEPYHNWRGNYIAANDSDSPFYNREYSEFTFSNSVYDYFIAFSGEFNEFSWRNLMPDQLFNNSSCSFCFSQSRKAAKN